MATANYYCYDPDVLAFKCLPLANENNITETERQALYDEKEKCSYGQDKMVCNRYEGREVFFPKKIINTCLERTNQHLLTPETARNISFEAEELEWDTDPSGTKTVGYNTLCLTKVQFVFQDRKDLVVDISFTSSFFNESFILKYNFGPCFSKHGGRVVEDGTSLKFDPQLKAGSPEDGYVPSSYDDSLYIYLEPLSADELDWEQAKRRSLIVQIKFLRSAKYIKAEGTDEKEDPRVMIIAIVGGIGCLVLSFGLYKAVKRCSAILKVWIKKM